jgi:hypothetical protein
MSANRPPVEAGVTGPEQWTGVGRGIFAGIGMTLWLLKMRILAGEI